MININIWDINKLKCKYGINKTYVDVTRIILKIVNGNIKKNKIIIKINVNNKTMQKDPFFNKKKHLIVIIKNEKYIINENNDVIFTIIYPENIYFLKDLNVIKNEFSKYNKAVLFGKGPTFKNTKCKNNELRCAINQAANLISGVDIICMNDLHNISLIDDKVYNNLKYLLIPQYLHINQNFSNDGYFLNIFDYLKDRFYGKFIVYNLITSKINTKYLISMSGAISSANNLFEFICKFTDIKNVNTYGIGIKSNIDYHKNFVGNGKYTDDKVNRIKNNFEMNSRKYKVKIQYN
jgi:hypothetical protein